jgi:hypothetical protein
MRTKSASSVYIEIMIPQAIDSLKNILGVFSLYVRALAIVKKFCPWRSRHLKMVQ